MLSVTKAVTALEACGSRSQEHGFPNFLGCSWTLGFAQLEVVSPAPAP